MKINERKEEMTFYHFYIKLDYILSSNFALKMAQNQCDDEIELGRNQFNLNFHRSNSFQQKLAKF